MSLWWQPAASISCFIMGCDNVRQAVSDQLGIEPGETTEDGRFTLLPIVCLGACDKAPAMTIDDQLIGRVEIDEIPEILERFE